MPQRSVLVTGATSLIINDLIDKLLTAGCEVTGITRKVKDSLRDDIKWIEWDLTKTFSTELTKKYNIIVHAASVSNSYHPFEYVQVNVIATQNICRLAQQLNIKRFIYVSSVLACRGCGLYGESELRAEQIISSVLRNWIIVRPTGFTVESDHKNPINRLITNLKNSNFAILPADTLKNLYPLYYRDFTEELMKMFFSEPIRN
ncbi:MAG: NAD(P)-dependent oxidoreductase [Bacteroidota bacterium]|nr:NAD(P)-dependent oxidoreductase [Bacteroidota bacterium]